MPSDVMVVAVNWHGPFATIQAAGEEAEREKVSEGLYLAINPENKAYTGISGNLKGRLTESHHVLGKLRPSEAAIWVGVVKSQEIQTGALARQSKSVRLAEHMMSFFLQLSENSQLKSRPPADSVVLLNRWYEPSSPYGRRSKRGHPDWPDLIEFDVDLGEAQLVWYGTKRWRWSQKDVTDLAS